MLSLRVRNESYLLEDVLQKIMLKEILQNSSIDEGSIVKKKNARQRRKKRSRRDKEEEIEK